MIEETTDRIIRAPHELEDKVQSIICQVEDFERWLAFSPDREDIRGEFPVAMEALIKDFKEAIILAGMMQSAAFNEPAIAVLSDWLEARAKSSV